MACLIRFTMLIETERLTLSEFTAEDAPFILELLNTPSWLKYIGDRNVHSLDDARNYLQYGPMSGYKRSGFGFYNVRLKDEDKPIGMCGLVKRDTLDHPDLGFAFLPAFEKQGYGYEAASATLAYARGTLKLERLEAITLENNAASIGLLKKLGFAFERRVRMGDEELMLFAVLLLPGKI